MMEEEDEEKGKREKGRLQLTNGYAIDFDQIARLLNFASRWEGSSVPYTEISAAVGISDIHAEFLSRLATLLGLLMPRTRLPSPFGQLVAEHDALLDDLGTLWYLHYHVASEPLNIVWHTLASDIVPVAQCFTLAQFRVRFESIRLQFTKSSFQGYVAKETRSLLDAYTNQNFSRLMYLRREGEDGYAPGYRETVPPLVLAACIARFRARSRAGDTALSIQDLLAAPDSPGVVCQITEDRMRAGLESLKSQSGLSLESRADLDQVRLTDATTDWQWMERYYASRR